MVVAVDATSAATVKSATNVIKWATLHGNAKKTLIDATDAMVIIINNKKRSKYSNQFNIFNRHWTHCT